MSSRVVSMPLGEARKSRVVSMDPNSFGPEFDVIQELTYNRDEYAGEDWISIWSAPSYVRTCVDRIRESVGGRVKPSLSSTMSCCLANGSEVISSDEHVAELLRLKRKLLLADAGDMGDIEELAEWFRSFKLTVSDSTLSGSKSKWNMRVPLNVRTDLQCVADDMGLSISSISILSVIVTLSTQPVVLRGHRDEMERTINRFFTRVKRRVKVAEALLSTL